jgi:glycosyltransferase involved in cell wall biosynthesis
MKAPDFNPDIATQRNLFAGEPMGAENFRGLTMTGGLRTMGYWKQDQPDLPLVTVITVVRNDAGHIAETILSVLHQTYSNLELIVVDGGSMDGTLDIIKRQEHSIDLWISGTDSGIYDAMNKALDLANGRHIHFLNSGDHYSTQRVLEVVTGTFGEKRKRWLHANVLMIDKKGGKGWIRYSDVSRYYYLFKGIPQQAFFFEKSLFSEYGQFNLDFRIVADLDFLLRVMLDHGIPGAYLNMPVVIFDTGGVSGNMKRKEDERNTVLRRHFPAWAFYFLKNKMMRNLLVRNEARNRKKSLLEKLMSRL